MHRLAVLLVASAASLAGCMGTVRSSGSVGVYTPDLVVVSPGISVVADNDEPVFYDNSHYWRYYDGQWYRSTYYNRGWRTYNAPSTIRQIERPETYRHYRRAGDTVRRHRVETRDRDRGRDHDRGRGQDRDRGGSSGPVIRDHRR